MEQENKSVLYQIWIDAKAETCSVSKFSVLKMSEIMRTVRVNSCIWMGSFDHSSEWVSLDRLDTVESVFKGLVVAAYQVLSFSLERAKELAASFVKGLISARQSQIKDLQKQCSAFERFCDELGVCKKVETAAIKLVQIPVHFGDSVKLCSVRVRWVCPCCGGERGELIRGGAKVGNLRCDLWVNPCGHPDEYSSVWDEALRNGLNVG